VRRRGLRVVLALASILVALAFAAVPTFGATITDRPLLFSFDGSDTTAGPFRLQRALEIDQATGTVYVIDEGHNVLDKFNLAGEAQDYSATGSSSLATGLELRGGSDVAVDNSSVNPGRIYISQGEGGPVKAYSPAGNELWKFLGTGSSCGLAVDSQGHLWVADSRGEKVREYDSSGSPPAEIGSVSTAGNGNPCRIDLDASGNLYVNNRFGGVDKYEGGVKTATLDPASSNGVTVDRSSPAGHVFVLHEAGTFGEYSSSGALVGTFGGGNIASSGGIAYDQAQDRVYVSDVESGSVVKVFGPVVTGTVPDVTIEAPSEVGVSKAKFSGKVNPQGVSNAYFFEWKNLVTGEVDSSPIQSLPEDNAEHAVSFNATGLAGNIPYYEVRLVGVNTESKLRSFSSYVPLATKTAPAAPAATIDDVPPAGTTTASISGTVNPQEDAGTTWRVELSTEPSCASGFNPSGPIHKLESEATSPVVVSTELTGLLTAQHYCARISATNSAGTEPSGVKEFETQPVLPDGVQTAFVAPRSDTSARLNGRANPHGAPLTYHFEYSEDGGNTWIALPDQSDASHARHQIIVSEELSGLQPDTTYSYRVVAENVVGPATQQGGELSFATRTSAEVAEPQSCSNEDVRAVQHAGYLGDCRALELVNQPDKGNQNVLTLTPATGASPVSSNGEEALWSVFGGAPGGNTASGATFLSQRTPEGWKSKSLVPLASEQFGDGEDTYALGATTPDFSKFIFVAGRPHFSARQAPGILRLDRNQNQDLLTSYPNTSIEGAQLEDVDASGSHVLILNPETRELEDIGSGTPEVVSLMPDGMPPSCPLSMEGQSFIDVNGNESGAGANWRPAYHRMATTDGSRVYFEANPPGRCSDFGPFQLYQRNRETETTTLIDPAEEGGDSYLIRATPNGRSVYFTTRSALDPADTNTTLDVYRWDEESNESHCLTCVVPDADLSSQSVMISDDFSHIYFESRQSLIPGRSEAGLYVLSNGAIHLAAGDVYANLNYGIRPSAELTPDGEVLVFFAAPSPSMTSDKVLETCADAEEEYPGQPCKQLYRYDDHDRSLECISCASGLTTSSIGERLLSIPKPDFRVSDDGNTIAFVTGSTLLRRDVNRSVDIYEWHDGVRHLLTDGVSRLPTGLLSSPAVRAISADGRDIFFSASDPGRTGFEQDGLANLYDARIDGGFMPPNPPVHCSEESCQGPLQPAPQEQRPGSPGVNGLGNQTPQRSQSRCASKRGKAKKRCSQKKKQHKHHKKQGKSRSRNSGTRHNVGGAK
jgi:hypothetical protein